MRAGHLSKRFLGSLWPFGPGAADEQWVAVSTILDESVVRKIIPRLKAAGAEGIIEYPLNKVVY